MDLVWVRVIDHCRPYPSPPPLLEIHVPRCTTVVALTEELRRDQLALFDPFAPRFDSASPEEMAYTRDGYLPGCVTLALAPVDEATHGALFRARTDGMTLGDLGIESLRGRLNLIPVTLPLLKACPFVVGAPWTILSAAQRMAALKQSGEVRESLTFFVSAPCTRWLASQLCLALSDVDVGEYDVATCTVHVVPWGQLVRTREGFARYPQAVREHVFTLLLTRNRGVFGMMDRHLCFLIADYVVSVPQPDAEFR